ncbi:MAG TPA: tetratricopeptide repeat protein, partial [Candidatus Polarisedimenticolia bacterium]|nr:tetratricopeptide repeat protein [Candidatus Polarisedimenticolia bacterium]
MTPDSASVFFNMGQAYMKGGDETKALAAFEKAVAVDPSKSESFMAMASIYEKQKNTAKAQEMYEKVIAIDPKNASTSFYNIGARAWNENRTKDAAQAYAKAIEIDPSNALAHRELGTSLMRTQDFAGALKHFQEYLRLQPNAPDAKQIRETIALLK